MSKKVLIALVVLFLAGAGFFLLQNDDEINGDTSNNEMTTQQETNNNDQQPIENDLQTNPFLPTVGQSFIANVSIDDPQQGTIDSLIEYDGANSWHYAAEIGGQRTEIILIDTMLYTFDPTSNSWFSYPTGDAPGNFFDPDAYEYDGDELDSFRSLATNIGTDDCNNGPCEVWTADNFQGQQMFTMAFDQATGRISRVSSTVNGATSLIEYTYTDVSIEAPANAQSFDFPVAP